MASDEEYDDESQEEYNSDNEDEYGILNESRTVENSGDIYKNQLLDEDVNDVVNCGFLAGYDRNSLELSCWVGFQLSRLSPDILFACGLDPQKSIAIRLVFSPPVYCSSCPTVSKKHINIRQTDCKDFSKISLANCELFGLWWTLEQRLSNYMQSHWASIMNHQKQNIESLTKKWKLISEDDIKSLMEIHNIDRSLARFVLHKANHLENAHEILLDERIKNKLISQSTNYIYSQKQPHDNFLNLVRKQVMNFMEDSTASCIVCNLPHPLRLLKPTVCSSDLCNFQFTNLGLGINLENEINKAPQACDLIIHMTSAASESGKLFEPFPLVETNVLQPDGSVKRFAFTRDNPIEVSQVLSTCPSIEQMRELILENKLRSELDSQHPLLYKLLCWIIGTNRAHLHYIEDPESQVKGVQTKWQFVLKSALPEIERAFVSLKQKHKKTFYAFHGSNLGNWHSILRMGLKVYSGTDRQLHGAAFGPGIYMAVDGEKSLSYSSSSAPIGWNKSMFGVKARCISLCEVIDYGPPEPKKCIGGLHRPFCKHSSKSPHYRAELEELVVTRYLFIYSATDHNRGMLTKDIIVPNI